MKLFHNGNWVRFQQRAAIVLFLFSLVFVFVEQVPDAGFRKGHRGWVASHALAIIEKASPANGFVGYAIGFVDQKGIPSYYYFDRYPFFFSATMRVALNIFDLSLKNKIYVARQMMNLIYVLTLIAAALLLIELEFTPAIAVAVATLAGSGFYLVEYRDMVHFDQPALLGCIVLMRAIARWYRSKKTRVVTVAVVFAVCMGRGYASFPVLGIWWITEVIHIIYTNFRSAPKRILLGVPTRACLLSIAVAASCLSYNVLTEAKLQEEPISEVGIVKSALKRTSFDDRFNRKHKKRLTWERAIVVNRLRAVEGLPPAFLQKWIKEHSPSKYWWFLGVALVIGTFIVTRRPTHRITFLVMSLSGLTWLLLMKGLSLFHDYTAMYFLGLYVTFYAAILSLTPKRVQVLAAVLACACLVNTTYKKNRRLKGQSAKSEKVTEDFQRIAAHLNPGDYIAVDPYAIGFYLPEQIVLKEEPGTLYVTRNKEHKGTNLTPENRKIFLFRVDANYP
jgi:hypothetical protein